MQSKEKFVLSANQKQNFQIFQFQMLCGIICWNEMGTNRPIGKMSLPILNVLPKNGHT